MHDGDSLGMLFRLVAEQELGPQRLREALTQDDSVRHFNDVVVPLLRWLAAPELQVGPRKKLVDRCRHFGSTAAAFSRGAPWFACFRRGTSLDYTLAPWSIASWKALRELRSAAAAR
jgi:hypothetical protein